MKRLLKALMEWVGMKPEIPKSVLLKHEVTLTAMGMMDIHGPDAWASYVRGRLLKSFIEKVEPYIIYTREPLPGGSESFKMTLMIVDREGIKDKQHG